MLGIFVGTAFFRRERWGTDEDLGLFVFSLVGGSFPGVENWISVMSPLSLDGAYEGPNLLLGAWDGPAAWLEKRYC